MVAIVCNQCGAGHGDKPEEWEQDGLIIRCKRCGAVFELHMEYLHTIKTGEGDAKGGDGT